VSVAILVRPLARRTGENEASRADYDLSIYRDQLAEVERDLERGILPAEQAEAARTEIKRRMLAATPADASPSAPETLGGVNRLVMGVIAVVLPVGALGLYLYLGSPDLPGLPFAERAAEPERTAEQASPHQSGAQAQKMEDLVGRLAERLLNNPEDLQGWMLLGRSYMTMGRFGDAANAYRHAVTLSDNDLRVSTDYAEALVQANGGTVMPEAHQMFTAALEADPRNVHARYYLGVEKAQQGDMRSALQAWVDVVSIAPPNAPWLPTLKNQVARTAQEMGVDLADMKPSPEVAGFPRPAAPPAVMPPPAASSAPAPDTAQRKAAAEMTDEEREEMIRTMVERLAERLKDEPDDMEGWQRLARAYEVLGERDKAREANARVKALQNR
jgi:cytochrome c-type biogenesis protein CcmH